jgi:tRNA (uracil-5-)-methyltransferase TRM9
MLSDKEIKYVKDVYEEIASEFSMTRAYLWGSVKHFIQDQSPNSIGIEIGCGNGKNMLYRDDIEIVGIDFCENLCKIVNNKGKSIVNGNCINLPFRSNIYDFALCIAVIHHLDSYDKRMDAIDEIIRVIIPGAKCIMQVWAVEQPSNSKRSFTIGDNIVIWKGKKGKSYERYYYIFESNELLNMVNKFNVEIIDYFNEVGNWCVIFKKL